jgi:hypothetical protein
VQGAAAVAQFAPALAGLDGAPGLAETVLRCLALAETPDGSREPGATTARRLMSGDGARLRENIFLTGGLSLLPNLGPRLQAELGLRFSQSGGTGSAIKVCNAASVGGGHSRAHGAQPSHISPAGPAGRGWGEITMIMEVMGSQLCAGVGKSQAGHILRHPVMSLSTAAWACSDDHDRDRCVPSLVMTRQHVALPACLPAWGRGGVGAWHAAAWLGGSRLAAMPGFASLCVSRETYMRTQELPVANTWTRGLLQVEVAVKEAGRVRDAHPCISYLPHVCPPSLPPSLP